MNYMKTFYMDFHGEQLVKHRRHPSKLLSNFLNKAKIFSDISLLRLGKNTSIALQNMTEFPPHRKKKKNKQKNKKTKLSKHSKKFSFTRLQGLGFQVLQLL